VKPLFIQNGHIIDTSQGLDDSGGLLIAGGKVMWLGRGSQSPPVADYDVLPAAGLVVCPGFIDLHCHLREPGGEHKETIASGTEAAARGGFVTICCMPNTDPPLDNRATLESVQKVVAEQGKVRVLPIGCVSRGRQGKELAPLAELASAGVVGFSDDGDPVASSTLMRRALEFSCEQGLPIIDHCEDKNLSGGGLMNEGAVSRRLGLSGIPAAAEENMIARDLELAEVTGGWLHVAHVSTVGSVELIRRAQEKGVRVTAEVTPHHLTLTDESVSAGNTNAKVNPPLRTGKDIQALLEGLKGGVIDIIATDHAPHTEAEKRRDFALAPFGISGLETAFGSLMGLVHSGQISLITLIDRLTRAPAAIIGDRFGRLGTLAVGATADVVVFDPAREWVVDTAAFASKGKNTPLAGATLKGKVLATISRGRLVYKDDVIGVKEKGLVES